MASAAHATEKSIAHQNQHQQRPHPHPQPLPRQQQVLKCPRCDSSNTKFCYYNNYSLSQPRHFCKACKRYWTRGGTLRNVPVGGGCRKNKRIKTTTFTKTVSHNPNPNPNLDHSAHLHTDHNRLCGLLQQNPKYPSFNSRVSDVGETDFSRFDTIYPQMSSFGLGFSLSDAAGETAVTNHNHATHDSVSIISNYPSMFSSGSTSSLQQPQRFLAPYGNGCGSVANDVKMEGIQICNTDWNDSFNGQNDNNQIKGLESSDPTSFLWTITGGDGGDWLDPTSNICSPVPSLL